MQRFAPLDFPGDGSLVGLFHHYDIPADFLTERLKVSWFHYLCKNIDVEQVSPHAGPSIVESHPANAEPLSQDNWTWLRSAFFLKSGVGGPPAPCITLVCFGASASLEQRFRDLAASPSWTQCLDAPYNLLVVVLDELFLEMNDQAWRLADVFRTIEQAALRDFAKTSRVWITPSRQDIVGLHNIAKQCFYLREAFDAIDLTVQELVQQHLRIWPDSPARQSTSSLLRYKLGLFRSVNLRLASLDRRIANIHSLSFNLRTAQDSRVMQKDSNAIKSITLLAFVFLPASTVAAVFSTPFFSADDGASPKRLVVSENVWMFWSVVVPLTVVVVVLWLAHDRITVRRWEKALQRRGEDK
ncbi:uncharacterized protein UV8b_01848 [Ustilaginoidea virens]|uniref:Mg2+ transporter protein, CorA-like/Zinc transport protein ZntB n=1 Tax=Ustilaginoidea virens TaxID=1159556 RepID=A0A8E5HLQ2_USTVR|nr:uncharacterized protein UV8b_01848 [Ustilaginoidea virens]QUC17607.1 hypothetical protein UV8b_01848 [Ustilaginoidea virens]